MADKITNNDSAALPVGSGIASGLTPSASDPGPVMSSSANNILLTNPLSTNVPAVVGNQSSATTVTTSLPINTLQNVTGSSFSNSLISHTSNR